MRESLSMREMAERAMEGGVLGIEPPRPGQQSQELVWRQVYPPTRSPSAGTVQDEGQEGGSPSPAASRGWTEG